MAKRVLFLDRDGTINVDRGYVRCIDQWEFSPGAVAAIKTLRDAGFAIAIVTNQSGIGRGIIAQADVAALHEHLQRELARLGAAVDAIAVCPHLAEDQCACRKPAIGMATQIASALGEPIDFAGSWTVGDKISDAEFGRALGTRVGLILSRHWSECDLPFTPNAIADSLAAVSRQILNASSKIDPLARSSSRGEAKSALDRQRFGLSRA